MLRWIAKSMVIRIPKDNRGRITLFIALVAIYLWVAYGGVREQGWSIPFALLASLVVTPTFLLIMTLLRALFLLPAILWDYWHSRDRHDV